MASLQKSGFRMQTELKELEALNGRVASLENTYSIRVRIVAQALGKAIPLFEAPAD